MSLGKFGQYINDRLPLFVGIGMIISIHWGWSKLQQVPYLVTEEERKKEFPPIAALRFFVQKIRGNPDMEKALSELAAQKAN